MPNPSRWDEARSILEVGSGAALVVACMASLYFMRSPQELREIEMGQRRDVVRAAMDIAMGIDESVDMEGEIGANMVRVVDHLQDYYDVRINPNPDPNATVTRTCGQSVVSAIEGSMASPQQMVRNLLDLINRGIVSDRHTSRLPESNHTASSSAQQANPGDHPGIHGQDTPPHIALTIEDYESDPQEEAFFDAVQVIEEGPRPRE
ncbi:MAG TPA: hypothetical protein VFP68_13250 [Burkholderiaceae bacterium]|nr:hypothetical protein [Burkholderiaceae bacterium]